MGKTAQQAAQNYQQSMASGQTSQKYKDGINSTTVNPMQEAARPEAMQRYLDAVTDSVVSGRRAAKLQKTPITLWKENALNIGASRLASGAQKALPKVQAHFQDWMPTYQQAHEIAKSSTASGMARVLEIQGAIYQLYRQKAGKSV